MKAFEVLQNSVARNFDFIKLQICKSNIGYLNVSY